MQRYRDPNMQGMYDSMLKLAHDCTTELYYNGQPRRGAGHRAAFWDGYSGKFTLRGPKRSPHVIPGTLSHACFMAGRAWRKESERERQVVFTQAQALGKYA